MKKTRSRKSRETVPLNAHHGITLCKTLKSAYSQFLGVRGKSSSGRDELEKTICPIVETCQVKWAQAIAVLSKHIVTNILLTFTSHILANVHVQNYRELRQY
jgi:hypothetical protein